MKNEKQSNFINVQKLSKSFCSDGNVIKVLEDINFSVQKGEVVVIMGPSGVGKSTLLNLMGTLDIPDAGEVFYAGRNPFDLPGREIAKFRNEHIGFVFQFHHLLPEFTALENVLIPSMIYTKYDPTIRAKAAEMLSRVGLAQRLKHRPAELSGGERQRVAVARALINNPHVILADEPSGNLDVANSERLIDLLIELNQKYETTFVIATHNPAIGQRAHRIINLEQQKSGNKKRMFDIQS